MITCAKCGTRVGVIGACRGCKRIAKQEGATTPRNLSQIKQFLKPGMMLRRTHSKFCPEGETIPVVRVQGNAFTVRVVSGRNAGQESWHYYGKAPQYACDDRGFTVTLGDDYGIARYEYVTVEG